MDGWLLDCLCALKHYAHFIDSLDGITSDPLDNIELFNYHRV